MWYDHPPCFGICISTGFTTNAQLGALLRRLFNRCIIKLFGNYRALEIIYCKDRDPIDIRCRPEDLAGNLEGIADAKGRISVGIMEIKDSRGIIHSVNFEIYNGEISMAITLGHGYGQELFEKFVKDNTDLFMSICVEIEALGGHPSIYLRNSMSQERIYYRNQK
jgi:hypothetical protein